MAILFVYCARREEKREKLYRDMYYLIFVPIKHLKRKSVILKNRPSEKWAVTATSKSKKIIRPSR